MATRNKRKRNAKKKSPGFVFPMPLASVLFIVTVLSLAYLWLHGQCEALGARIQELEVEKERVHNRLLNEEYKWSNMQSLPNIRKALERHRIVMSWPDENRIIRIFTADKAEDEWMDGKQYARYNGRHD